MDVDGSIKITGRSRDENSPFKIRSLWNLNTKAANNLTLDAYGWRIHIKGAVSLNELDNSADYQ